MWTPTCNARGRYGLSEGLAWLRRWRNGATFCSCSNSLGASSNCGIPYNLRLKLWLDFRACLVGRPLVRSLVVWLLNLGRSELLHFRCQICQATVSRDYCCRPQRPSHCTPENTLEPGRSNRSTERAALIHNGGASNCGPQTRT
jgi:hypothetical protein